MPSAMSKIAPPVAFLPARAKLWIGSLDNPALEVRAQYNPRELQIDKQVPWADHKAGDNRSDGKRAEKNPSAQSDLEFTGAPKRSMSIELLFDGYEEGKSIEPDLRRLEEMSSVVDPESRDRRRPHHCIVAWGDSGAGMRPFRCVIESLAVKYTMWDHGGMPLRATCTVKLKEAHRMAGAGPGQERYGEKRRWSEGQEARPKAWETMSSEKYAEAVAWSRYRPEEAKKAE